MRKFFIVALLLMAQVSLFSKDLWTIGPMFHLNFGGEKARFSYGIEVAYWNIDHFPYSIDGGLEFERHKFRVYSELQTGIGVAGVSAGPVLEFKTDEFKINPGIQLTAWANYFFGIDMRFRFSGEKTVFSPGTYVKLPVGGSLLDDDNEEHHWEDWD